MRYRLRISQAFGEALLKFFQDSWRLVSHRARAAMEAASLRFSGVMFAARALPPFLPPLRPIWAMRCDTTDLVNLGSGEGPEEFPVSLFTAMMPAWNSSSGWLRERFRIYLQRGTSEGLTSTGRNPKVAHYPPSISHSDFASMDQTGGISSMDSFCSAGFSRLGSMKILPSRRLSR